MTLPASGEARGEAPLSTGAVLALAVSYTLIYVLPFYAHPTTRPSPTIFRDSNIVIRTRIRLVSISCSICAVITATILSYSSPSVLRAGATAGSQWRELLRLVGCWPVGLAATSKPLLLTAVLFAGPLFERGIVEEEWSEWITGKAALRRLRTWIGWRNFVAGPFTEELLFRSLLLPLFLLTPLRPLTCVFLVPLPFGLAHVHHCYEFILTHPRAPLAAAFVTSLFQLCYTTLFGWFAAWVFLRTGSLWAAVGSHAFCNWMGLPRVWGRLEGREVGVEDVVFMGGADGAGSGGGGGGPGGGRAEDAALGVGWTVAYYFLLVGGAVGFWKGLWVLTDSEGRLATF